MSELTDRLRELSRAVSDGRMHEFSMRIPAEPKRDADIVLDEAASLIESYESRLDQVRDLLAHIVVKCHETDESLSILEAPDVRRLDEAYRIAKGRLSNLGQTSSELVVETQRQLCEHVVNVALTPEVWDGRPGLIRSAVTLYKNWRFVRSADAR